MSAIEYYERQIIEKFGTETYAENFPRKRLIPQSFLYFSPTLPYPVLSVKAILEDLPESASPPVRNPHAWVSEILPRYEVEIALKGSKLTPNEGGGEPFLGKKGSPPYLPSQKL